MWRGWIAGIVGILFAVGAFATPAAAQENHDRMQIALIELEVSGGLDSTLSRPLSDRLRQELFKTGVFTVVERNVMENVLEEQSLHLAGCTSNECAVEVGRILGVQQIVAGSVSRVGIYLSINARLINVETTEVTAAESIDCECTLENVLTSRMREMAVKLALAVTQPNQNTTLDNISREELDGAEGSGNRSASNRDDEYQPELPPAIHMAGSKAALWMERLGIGAIDLHFGWTVTPNEMNRWVGSLSNGLQVQFPATRNSGWFHPEIQLVGGSVKKELDGVTTTATITGVYFRAYRFSRDPRADNGFYTGGGIGLLSRSEVETITPNMLYTGGTSRNLRGELGLEAFLGSQFDLNVDVGGRKLFTFLELRTEVTPIGDAPLIRISVQTGLGWKLDSFIR